MKKRPQATAYSAPLESHDLKVLEKRLAKGADVNQTDEGGKPELYWACRFGYVDKVRLLLKHNADPNIKSNGDGHTPAHAVFLFGISEAPIAKEAHLEIVRLLLDHGADLSIVDKYGKTPLDYALKISSDSPYRSKFLDLFREHAPELYFTAFCTAAPGA